MNTSTNPRKTSIEFDTNEIIEALSKYAQNKGVVVPRGRNSLVGIEDAGDFPGTVTLVVEVAP